LAVTPKDNFDFAFKRVNHFLSLYDLLNNSNQRASRASWKDQFKRILRWPVTEDIICIHGKDNNSLLLLKKSLGIERKRFAHDYTSELLRSSISASVSALDKYLHDIIVQNCIKLLSLPDNKIPNEFASIRIPVVSAKKALNKIKAENSARPGFIIKQEVQSVLHRDFTFQNSSSVIKAGRMLGITDFWRKVSTKMPGNTSKDNVISKLKIITNRRNQIVHESDIIRRISAQKITQRKISYSQALDFSNWIKNFVTAIDNVVSES